MVPANLKNLCSSFTLVADSYHREMLPVHKTAEKHNHFLMGGRLNLLRLTLACSMPWAVSLQAALALHRILILEGIQIFLGHQTKPVPPPLVLLLPIFLKLLPPLLAMHQPMFLGIITREQVVFLVQQDQSLRRLLNQYFLQRPLPRLLSNRNFYSHLSPLNLVPLPTLIINRLQHPVQRLRVQDLHSSLISNSTKTQLHPQPHRRRYLAHLVPIIQLRHQTL